jgi:uncharacterized OB-fold protein
MNTAGRERPVPRPEQNELYRPYWEYARRGEWRLQRCASCGHYIHFPKPGCPRCASTDLEWARMSGRGVVGSFILVRYLDAPGFDRPYIVAQVSPAEQESVRVLCNILECALEDVHIGMPVQVTFETIRDGWVLPQFRPA